MPWRSDGESVFESVSGSTDESLTGTSPGQASSDSGSLQDALPVHDCERGGPPWLQAALLRGWPGSRSSRATASDLHNLQITGQLLLKATADPAHKQGKVDQPRPAPQDSQPPPGPRMASALTPWLRRHPILGAVLEGELPPTRLSLPDAASVPLSPRQLESDVSQSPRHSFEVEVEAVEAQGPAGVRDVDRDILEQLRALSEAVKAISAPIAPAGAGQGTQAMEETSRAAEADRARAQKLAKANKRQQLLSSSCMALGVKDDRLLLLDCFLMWSQAYRSSKAAVKDASTKDAMAQATEDRPPALELPEPQGDELQGATLPVLPDHSLRALLGQEVWLARDGSLHGASLWLSMTPPQASRRFLHTFDICLPDEGTEVPARAVGSLQETSIQTSPRRGASGSAGSSPREAMSKAASKQDQPSDEMTPERVLRRISGLMTEMMAMETSLENLREEMEKEEAENPDEEPFLEIVEDCGGLPLPAPKQEPRSRLRSRLPASLSWLEEAARKSRPGIPMQSRGHAPKRAPRSVRRPGPKSSAR